MKFFDLHCDTATVLYDQKLSFDNNKTQLRKNALGGMELTQCFAVFFNDLTPDPPGMEYLTQIHRTVFPQLKETTSPLLTVEGAGVLARTSDDWIERLAELDCRMAGLCWNGDTPLGTGAVTNDFAPLKTQGKEAVLRLWEKGIVTDVSHLSAAGTEDVLSIAEFPVAASHSNLRSVWDHPRNLTDEAAKEIFARGGVIGLNLYPPFLGEKGTIDDLIRHAERFLFLGGENGLCLGGDLDGIERLPEGMTDISSYKLLFQRFQEAFGDTVCEKICYENAARFFACNRKE